LFPHERNIGEKGQDHFKLSKCFCCGNSRLLLQPTTGLSITRVFKNKKSPSESGLHSQTKIVQPITRYFLLIFGFLFSDNLRLFENIL
jgi:hypothetical protein